MIVLRKVKSHPKPVVDFESNSKSVKSKILIKKIAK